MRERTDYLGRDGYTWWVGEVEDNKDPSQLGRVKVRILGWYTGHKDKEAYTKIIPTKILPWANVLLPADAPQTKNAGTTTELQPGAWVLGFFLDGDEAQLPIVLGAFRGFQQKPDDKRTTVADGKVAQELKTNTPQQDDMAGQDKFAGSPFNKQQSKQPKDAKGTPEESRGGISLGEETVPGNTVTNPIKPPVNKQSIGDGVAGPAGEGFETDLERMLTELGEMASALGAGPGAWVSLITGNKVAGDKVREHLGKIINFLAGGIAGILSPLKELLAKVIAQVILALVKIISNFIPLGIINAILSLLDSIFDIFCAKKPAWLGLVQGAIMDTVNFANQMASTIVDKVASIIGAAVSGVTNRILSGITNAMNKIRSVAQSILAAVKTAKALAGAAKTIGRTVDMIFEFDFTKLDWGSLIAIIKMILGLLFQKDCGRKIKRPKARAWWPLIGTTECDILTDAIKGTPYSSFESYQKNGGIAGGGSYIDEMFTKINPYLMQTQTFLNGSKKIFDATPGVEKTIEMGPGGVTTFQDSWGNEHKNVPNNETKIIARDKCETIKGNYVLTVEGDFYLKVMGNYHEEIIGANNRHNSNGPQAEATGSARIPQGNYGKETTTTGAGTQAELNEINSNVAMSRGTLYDNRETTLSRKQSRETFLKWSNEYGGFYPVSEIPYRPDADEYGRTPNGPQLSGKLSDDKEQKAAERIEGDKDIAYCGEVRIQGSKVKVTGIQAVNINSQTVRTEASTIENVADGEIVNEANWITSFLNAGRFEIIAIFNPFAAITGQFSFVRGSIIDITTDLPFPTIAPPNQTRIGLNTTHPVSFNDILLGSTNGIHSTFILSPTGVISEFCTNGANITTVVTGLLTTSLGTGYMSTGCALGPHQVYGLPLLLN
jgi:hypothetical protein